MSQTEIWHVDLTFIFTPTDLDTHVIIFFFIFWDAHWKIYRLYKFWTSITTGCIHSFLSAYPHPSHIFQLICGISSCSQGSQGILSLQGILGLLQGSPPCPSCFPWVLDSSPLSFVTDRVCSLDRISRHSQVEGLQFVGIRGLSLLFADYTLMLAS